MNYYEARQLKDKSGWHFTCENDGQIWPVGNCADHGAHETREEAEECFRQYELDNWTERSANADTQHRCVVDGCEAFTSKFAELRHGALFFLCDDHRNRETLETLVEAPGRIVSSY